ncbi:unnamed protein product [Closterium sp. NIES-54]
MLDNVADSARGPLAPCRGASPSSSASPSSPSPSASPRTSCTNGGRYEAFFFVRGSRRRCCRSCDLAAA